jgi:hypothetical protein
MTHRSKIMYVIMPQYLFSKLVIVWDIEGIYVINTRQ